MREGWETKPLGEICDVIGGGTPPKGNTSLYIGDIPWATVRDMKSEVLAKTEFTISNEAVIKSSTNIIPRNNVIIATRVGLGKVCLLNQDTAINQDLRGIVPKDPLKLDVKFLFRWFQSIAKVLEDEGTGMTVKGVKLPFVKSLPLPLPSTSEQQRIVAILDEAFEGIGEAVKNAKKNLANARGLFESYLNSVFTQKGEGWVERKLGETVTSVSTGPFGSMLHKSDYIESGTPIVNPINIPAGRIIPNDGKTINEETVERLKTYVLDVDDIVIARRGEIGRCAVVEADQAGWICGTGCFYIKPSKELNPYFLANLLRSAKYREELESVATGATMKNLSNTSLQNLTITFPPNTEEQYEIVLSLDELATKTKSLEAIYQQKLTTLAELKQSLLQKAFAGELTAEDAAIGKEATA